MSIFEANHAYLCKVIIKQMEMSYHKSESKLELVELTNKGMNLVDGSRV